MSRRGRSFVAALKRNAPPRKPVHVGDRAKFNDGIAMGLCLSSVSRDRYTSAELARMKQGGVVTKVVGAAAYVRSDDGVEWSCKLDELDLIEVVK